MGALLTEVAFPRAPLLGPQEPSAEGEKLVPGALGEPLSLVSRLQSREFYTAKRAKMFFTVLKCCKQNESKHKEDYVIETTPKILTT